MNPILRVITINSITSTADEYNFTSYNCISNITICGRTVEEDYPFVILCRHRNSGGSVEMSDESESETDSSLADDESNGQVRRRSSTTSKKRRWLKEEVFAYSYYLLFLLLF